MSVTDDFRDLFVGLKHEIRHQLRTKKNTGKFDESVIDTVKESFTSNQTPNHDSDSSVLSNSTKPDTLTNIEPNKLSIFTILLIACLPFPFALLTFRKGYSNASRAISSIWMVLILAYILNQ